MNSRSTLLVATAVAALGAPGWGAENAIVVEGETLAVTSALGVYDADSERLWLHFFPVMLTPEQVARAVAEDVGSLSFELESPDPERWEYCPMASVNMQPIGPGLQLAGRPQNMAISTVHLKGSFYNTATALSGGSIPEDWGSLRSPRTAAPPVAVGRARVAASLAGSGPSSGPARARGCRRSG